MVSLRGGGDAGGPRDPVRAAARGGADMVGGL